MKLGCYKKTVRSWRAEDIVMKGISLCDLGHIREMLEGLYQKEVVLYEEKRETLGKEEITETVKRRDWMRGTVLGSDEIIE